MSTITNRRAALGVAGLGAATLLTSCSAVSITSVAAEDYSGEVIFNNYNTSAGEFQPATREKRAQNVPKPVKPDNADNHSVAGLYSCLGFYGAAYTYAWITGSADYIKQAALSDTVKNIIAEQVSPYIKDWLADPQISFELKEPKPRKEGDAYIWPVTLKYSLGDFSVNNGKARDTSVQTREGAIDIDIFRAYYRDGSWIFDDDTLPVLRVYYS